MNGANPRGEISTTAWSAYGDLTAEQVSARSALAAQPNIVHIMVDD
jgi:hypothetical protein